MMNPKMRILLISFVLLFIPIAAVFTLDIGTSFHIGNLNFEKTRVSDDTGFTGTTFPWGIDAFINQNISDDLHLHTGFFMDPILHNISYTLFTYRQDFFSIGVGPFFGIFNSRATVLKAGISTAVRLELPGILYLSFRADSSIGGRLVQDGDYIQERSDVSFGYYIRNAICSLNLLTKRYTMKTSAGESIDLLTEYSFKTDIFQKNVPYKVLISFAFQKLSKLFVESGSTIDHSLGSLVIGINVDVFLNDYLALVFVLDSSVYSFGMGTLTGISNPGPGGYLFRASTGFTLDIDNIPRKN